MRFNEIEWEIFVKYADNTNNLMIHRNAEGAKIRRSRERSSKEAVDVMPIIAIGERSDSQYE